MESLTEKKNQAVELQADLMWHPSLPAFVKSCHLVILGLLTCIEGDTGVPSLHMGSKSLHQGFPQFRREVIFSNDSTILTLNPV